MKLRQLFCHHKKVITTETLQQYNGHWGVVEKVEKCAKCGKVKYYYTYGHEHIREWKRV